MTQKISASVIDLTGIPAGAYLQNVMGEATWSQLQVNLASQITGQLPVSALSATGSPSAATFLRGDGTWASIVDLDMVTPWGQVTGSLSDQTDLAAALAARQPLDATLTGLASLDSTVGLVEQTGATTFTKRPMGIGSSSSIPTLADADARYSNINHGHTLSELGLGSAATQSSAAFAAASHTHSISDVPGLSTTLNGKEPSLGAGTSADYLRGDKTWQPLTKATVGLSNVNNTADADKPISSLVQSALASKLATSHHGSGGDAHALATGSEAGFISAADKTKLDGVSAGATANASDAALRDRSTHTGTQSRSTITMGSGYVLGRTSSNNGVVEEITVSTGLLLASGSLSLAATVADISGLQAALDEKVNSSSVSAFGLNFIASSSVSDARTLLNLGSAALEPLATFAMASHTHAMTDVSGLTAALGGKEDSLGAGTNGDYLRGDKTWQPLNKTAVGLANVDNTSDTDKPVSTATATALSFKAPISNPVFTGTVTLAADPVEALQAATKQYVDNVAQGIVAKVAVDVATDGNIILSGEQTIDGVLTDSSRVLVKSQTNPAQNGIYVSASGPWSRAGDMNVWSEIPSAFVFVIDGTTYANTGWVCIAESGGTLGSDEIEWTQFSGAGTYTASGGVSKNGNQFVLASMGARTLKGNPLYFSGAPSDLTGTEVTEMLDVFTSALKGLVPASGGGSTKYLRADGTWATPTAIQWGGITGTLTDQTDLAAALAAREPSIASGTTSQFWRGDKQWVVPTKSDVGLANVDNTSDANKPVSNATQLALNTKAPLSHVGTGGTAHSLATAFQAGFMSTTDKSKIDTIASGATVNSSDAHLLNRANHTGTQAVSTVELSGVGLAGRAGTVGGPMGLIALGNGLAFTGSTLNVISHAHAISEITGLQSALDTKLDDSQAGSTGLAVLASSDTAAARAVLALGSAATFASSAFATAAHAHAIAEVSGLQSALDALQPLDATLTALAALSSSTGLIYQSGPDAFTKRALGTATASDIPTRADADARYAALGHTHSISNITGLQAQLDDKIDDSQAGSAGLAILAATTLTAARTTLQLGTAAQANSSDFATASHTHLGVYAPVSHTHQIADIEGLEDALNDVQVSDPTLIALSNLDEIAGVLEQTGADTFAKRAIGVASATDLLTRAGGDGRYATTVHAHAIADITGLTAALNAKEDALAAGTEAQYYRGDKTWQTLNKAAVGLSNVDNTSDANKPISTATQTALNAKIDSSEKGAAGGVATLNGSGKVPTSQLPSLALTDVFVIGSQGDQLALTAEEGDVAVRTDLNKTFIHNGGATGTMADWQEMLTPTDQVSSVNGQTGAVTLTKSDVGLANVDNTSDANKPISTATQTALNLKADASALANKADASHTHAIADVTGLQTALDAKAASTHTHAIADVTGLQTVLDGKASTTHDHDADYAALSHDHAIGDVTGLSAALAALAPINNPTFTGTVTLAADPIAALQAATKQYVDDVVSDAVSEGFTVHEAVQLASTGNISSLSGEQTIDGVLTSASRVLVKDQADATQNGIYVTASGAWSRATDADVFAELPGAYVFVQQGTLNANSGWICTAPAGGTLGSDDVTFDQFSSAASYTASGGLTKVGTDFRLANMAAATIKGNATGGSAAPTDLTGSQVTALLDVFTSSLKGLVPSSGGGTDKYLRSDASWATLDKTAVGLSNVNNTSDANKPISTATQTALDAKLDDSQATVFGLSLLGAADAAATTALLNTFTTTLKGLVPAPTTATGKFLKDNGTWDVPTGVTTFQGLTDAADYVAGDANKVVQVNSNGTGLVYGVVLGTAASQNSTAFATASHTHAIADITNLQSSLNSKLNASAISAFGLTLVDDVDAAAARTTLELGSAATADSAAFAEATHSHAQSEITGLSAALANKEPTITSGTTAQYWRGDKSWQTLNKAAVGLSNVDNTSDVSKPVSTATQTALDLKAPINNPTFTGTVTLPADPTLSLQAATKQYVDNIAHGLNSKISVKCATTANVTLSGEQTIDGVLTSGSRVLVKNQSTTSANGIYVTAAGAWTRASDMNTWAEVPSAFVFVGEGSTYAGTGWVCTAATSGTLGTTAITWAQFSGAGAYTATGGITQTGTSFSLTTMAANTLKGNNTGSTAAPADLTVAQVRSLLTIDNLDNTSDANKPISTATQTALNLKANLAGAAFTAATSVSAANEPFTVNSTNGNRNKINFQNSGASEGHIGSTTEGIVLTDSDNTVRLTAKSTGIGVVGDVGASGNITAANFSGSSSGTNTGDQTITLTGDVTGSGTGSFAATIGANKVTLAKLAQVATATFLGRTTAATGDVEAMTATQATALLNTATTALKGLMSSADKTKLDGIASGATANTGTVTSVSVTTANGVSGTVATNTTTPAITLALGDITPTGIDMNISGAAINVTDTAQSATPMLKLIRPTPALPTELVRLEVTGSASAPRGPFISFYRPNGVGLSALAGKVAGNLNGIQVFGPGDTVVTTVSDTGLAVTGVVSATGNISAANFSGTSSGTNTGDQTTITGNAGSATVLQTARTINGVSFNGSANITVTANTTNSLTFNTTGGATAGTIFDGGTARTIDYTTVGAAAAGHNHSGVYEPAFTTLGVAKGGTGVTTSTGTTNNVLSNAPTLAGTVSITGSSAWNATTPGTGLGAIHLGVGNVTADAGGGITWFGAGGIAGNAHAGIYVNGNGASGTTMLLATTDSYATGARTAMSISPVGNVNIVRGTLSVAGNNVYTTANAATANTASTLVLRDASGNFSAGTITASLSGNATSATTATNATNAINATNATNATTAANLTGFSVHTSANALAANSTSQNSMGYVNTNISLFSQVDGILHNGYHSSTWQHQIFGDFRTGQVAIRGMNAGTWQAWRTVLDSSNYTSYAPSLTGSGASGTWGINITGNAATATSATSAGTATNATNATYASQLNTGATAAGNLTFNTGRSGLIGQYDATNTQAIWAMGDAYKMTGTASNTYGSFYGLGWSYNPGYGAAGNNPQSKTGLDHQLLLMSNGVTQTAIGSGIWTIGGLTVGGNTTISGTTNSVGAITQNGNQVLHAGNYNSYAPQLTGGGASGTWGISITGNSATTSSVAWTNVSGRPTAVSSFTNDANYTTATGHNHDTSYLSKANGAWITDAAGHQRFYFENSTTDNTLLRIPASSFIYFQNSSSTNVFTFTHGGDFTASGNVTAYSDISLKENVETIQNALEIVCGMRGVLFDRKDTGARSSGVIAQEFEQQAPELVQENENGVKSVAYGQTAGYFIEAIKDLKDIVDEQRSMIEELRAEIAALKGDK